MSEQHGGPTKGIPPGEIMAAAVGALFPPAIAIFLVVQLVLSIQAGHIDKDDPANQDKAVAARLARVGEVVVRDADAPVAAAGAVAAADGKAVYAATCAACHATGVAGAPKVGDKAAWAKRINVGVNGLVASATKGKNAMPPKGGNAALSEAELKAVVEYMVSQSK